MKSINSLFNLFRLDRMIQSRQDVSVEEIIQLIGGTPYVQFLNTWERVEEEYKNWGPFRAQRFWRVRGNDFIVDVYDKGNGYYFIVKVKETV